MVMLRPDSLNCPPGTVSYTIRPGDTFYSLARRFNTTVGAIASANPSVNPQRLSVGQVICIPTSALCPTGNYYTVKAGDTLFSISRRFNISLPDLIRLNPGINPNLLYVGQVICIPVPKPVCPENTIQYTVKPGDTFYRIALRLRVPLDAILRANPGINPSYLSVGQTICIPVTPTGLPPVKLIPVFVEGQTEYREARLKRSEQGYYIYVLPNFQLAAEEPGRDVLFSTFDDRFFVRIERLPAGTDIGLLRESALTELRLVGTPHELKGEEIFDPFFRNALFFLHASNPTFSKNIIVMEIGGSLFRFTMNIPNAEAAEGIVPSFYAMLRTIGIY
ncbi:MAG: LysM peptidoglycan-binding domain-containing protein [Bacillota bacterium]